jgi:ribosome-associated toxin RatA of RatAB toxin-antitoxin module
LINSPLAVAERVNPVLLASQPQRAILTGRNGQYVVRIVVNSSADTAWKVLTDYNNFYQFLPNVTSSKLLKVQGNQKVFEQVYRIKALIVDETSRIRLSASETYPKQIAFKLVEGEVKALQGSWTIEPISSKQVIIQHQVNVDPGLTRTRALFYTIYENTLKMTLEAIKKESERRN